MNRDEFCSLPPAIALGLIYDVAASKLMAVPLPNLPYAPKFDRKLYKKAGFVWMSEMQLEDLKFWHGRAEESVASGDPKYLDANEKQLKELGLWIKWRTCYPDQAWSGERDHSQVTAEVPRREPTLHAKNSSGAAAPKAPTPSLDDDDGSDIPF